MHAVFIPYGKKEWVEQLLRDMSSQKLLMTLKKEGEKDIQMITECQLRILPFGLYELVFPREHKDIVLTTMHFHEAVPYHLDRDISIFGFKFSPLEYVRKFLNLEVPVFKAGQQLFWIQNFTGIIPIGIREDKDITEPQGDYKGWTHEGI